MNEREKINPLFEVNPGFIVQKELHQLSVKTLDQTLDLKTLDHYNFYQYSTMQLTTRS